MIKERLENLRNHLVDTGFRNPLIHVNRESARAKALNIRDAHADEAFRLLRQAGKKLRFAAKDTENHDPIKSDRDSTAQIYRAKETENYGLIKSDDAGGKQEIALPRRALPSGARRNDTTLQTELTADALQKRLLQLMRAAKTAEEEQGVNILYLAAGFLQWYESENSDRLRESPLVLLPVALMRGERSSTRGKQATIHLLSRDDDIAFNLPLHKRLKDGFGVDLPAIEEDDDWKPSAYFDAVEDATTGLARWAVDRNGMRLGFFSFHKFLMWQDLNPNNWTTDDGGNSFLNHPLVGRLLGNGFDEQPPFMENVALDKALSPSDLVQVVDADASQTKVIQAVRAGRNLVVQGPPGTGKSQTITNILAAAAHDGKKVLFIAEKMAALDVVYKRMQVAGLSEICLELHSRHANKKEVLVELQRTLILRTLDADESSSCAENLRQTRDQLNRITDLLHNNIPHRGYSPFNALAQSVELRGRDVPAPEINRENLHLLTDEDVQKIVGLIEGCAIAMKRITPKAEHPFRGVQSVNLSPTDLDRIVRQIENENKKIDSLLDTFAKILNRSGMKFESSIGNMRLAVETLRELQNAPHHIANTLSVCIANLDEQRFRDGVFAGADWRQSKEDCAKHFNEPAWEYPLNAIRMHIAKGATSFASRVFGKYRNACREFETILNTPLPKAPSARLQLVDSLVDVQKKRKVWTNDQNYMSEKLGVLWRSEQTDFLALRETIGWLDSIKAKQPDMTPTFVDNALKYVGEQTPDIAGFGDEINAVESGVESLLANLQLRLDGNLKLAEVNLVDLNGRFKKMKNNTHGQYSDWRAFLDQRNKIDDLDAMRLPGLPQLMAKWDGGSFIEDNAAANEFRYAVADARWKHAIDQLPALNELEPHTTDRTRLVEKFKLHETTWREDVVRRIRGQHRSQLPRGDAGEMKFLRGEMAKKARHKSIRTIMQSAGKLITGKIKPVLLMSPISIAQFLKPNRIEFDLLVIDEASQVRPADALGAIARVKQIVVVGDQKQLPPTSFFTRLTDVEDDALDADSDEASESPEAIEMESVLTLCEARGISQSMLEWHYRSRDPSLIAVSNQEFYDNRLIIPPAPMLTGETGLKFNQVPGVYEKRRNIIEANAVVAAVAVHAKQHPHLSLGVVTFSITQADVISEILESKRREDSVLDDFLRQGDSANGKPDTFVKNIENVQGDEREVIFVSVGYGPAEPNKRLSSMRFGPVNNEGGERRLNVLFTRAQIRCEIYASFPPQDIDSSRSRSKGLRVLKKFLQYAKNRQLPAPCVTGAGADSPFEIDVARVIEAHGYSATPQVQHGKFKIDIGVGHPQRRDKYILAVECDGATYHSALWARERDRQRQEILELQGWRFHRIWSTDWFYRRDDAIARLVDALADANKQDANPKNSPRNKRAVVAPSAPDSPTVAPPELPPAGLTVPHYEEFQITELSGDVAHDNVRKIIVSIVETEGPVHVDIIARRIAEKFNNAYGVRIKRIVREQLTCSPCKQRLKSQDDFWFTAEQQADCPVRDRSLADAPIKVAANLPDMEIRTAAKLIKAESGEVEPEELVQHTAKLLGFGRVGEKLKNKIRQALQQ